MSADERALKAIEARSSDAKARLEKDLGVSRKVMVNQEKVREARIETERLKGARHDANEGKRPVSSYKALRTKCREYSEELSDELIKIAKGELTTKVVTKDGNIVDVDMPVQARLKALELALAYGHGRPTNVVGEDPDLPFNQGDLKKMSQSELQGRVMSILGAKPDPEMPKS